MKNKLKITIGICAYNEENNIKNVLKGLLEQNQTDWTLDEIIVACGGCTDNTVERVKSVQSNKIQIIVNPKREGKANDQQKIHDSLKSDFLVLFDGDVVLKDKDVINKLIKPFKLKNVMLIGGNSQPYPPQSFFEKAVYTTFTVFYKSRNQINNGNNIFGCSGQILAMRRKLAKEINFPTTPPIINEDAYIYLKCMSKNYEFRYVDNAIVYFKLPKNIRDYIKQVFRSDPRAVTAELQYYFGNKVWKEFHRPFRFYVKSILETFFINPLGLITIVLTNIGCKILIPFVSKNYKLDWFTANSTK